MYNDVDESSQMLARCQRVQRVFSTKRLAHSQSNKPLPPSKWTNLQYRREFFEAAEKALGLQNKEQWYLISASQVRELGGYRLLLLYGNSLAKALADTFPEHNWQFYRFLASPVKERATPQQPKYENMTEAVKEHRQVFEEFARDKKITTFDDWYGVTWHAIKKWDKNQMYPIIRRYYDNSLPKALQVLFPEHEWLPWKFSRTATNYWSSIDNCRHYLSRLALELGISSMEQWYSLTKEHIVNYDGRGLLDHFNDSVAGMLMATFPKHEWKPWLFVYVPRHTWDYILSDSTQTFCHIISSVWLILMSM